MSTPNFSDKDIDNLVRSIGKPAPERIRANVMAKVAEIDREQAKATKAAKRQERTKNRDEIERE